MKRPRGTIGGDLTANGAKALCPVQISGGERCQVQSVCTTYTSFGLVIPTTHHRKHPFPFVGHYDSIIFHSAYEIEQFM